jgi:hypothetical protein
MWKFVPIILVTFSLTCCRHGGSSEPEAAISRGEALSPENVLRRYQAFVDSNRFEEAKQYSTSKGREWLNELAAIIAAEAPELQDSTILHTRFLNINCRGKGDIVHCLCLVEDEYERYETEYVLVWEGDRWLVDAPDDNFIIEDHLIEQMLESLQDSFFEEKEEEKPPPSRTMR